MAEGLGQELKFDLTLHFSLAFFSNPQDLVISQTSSTLCVFQTSVSQTLGSPAEDIGGWRKRDSPVDRTIQLLALPP